MIIPKFFSRFQVVILLIIVTSSVIIGGLIADSIDIREKIFKQNSIQTGHNLIPTPQYVASEGVIMNVLFAESESPKSDDYSLKNDEDKANMSYIWNEIFPKGIENYSNELKVITIEKYVTCITGAKILQEGTAICGGMADTFKSLVKGSGLPARNLIILGLKGQGGHSLVEVYYDGDWHLFDPTFGTFFYSEQDYNSKGYIPSLKGLLINGSDKYTIFTTVNQPWMGEFNSCNLTIMEMETNFFEDRYGSGFKKSYYDLFNQTFPIKYSDKQIVSYPIIVDISNSTKYSIGNVDSSSADMIRATADINTAGKIGQYFIDNGAIHTWFVNTPSEGLFSIKYFSSSENFPNLILFPLKSVQVVTSKRESNYIEYLLTTNSNESAIQFWTENGIFYIDAIGAEWKGKKGKFL